MRWWTGRQLRRHRIPLAVWRRVLAASPPLTRLKRSERHRLRGLASLFLQQKVIVAADDMVLDEWMRALIAAEASLLILNLGLDWYRGWTEIIVYSDAFLAPLHEVDGAGVVHEREQGRSGEAWAHGPLVLSWADIDPARRGGRPPGHNVVLHEFAHKLDFRDGAADGIPPLHRGNRAGEWAEDFSRAYADLGLHHREGVDPYGATSPAEFFAVMSELFFEAPQTLWQNYPAVYDELARFYRQEPGGIRA